MKKLYCVPCQLSTSVNPVDCKECPVFVQLISIRAINQNEVK